MGECLILPSCECLILLSCELRLQAPLILTKSLLKSYPFFLIHSIRAELNFYRLKYCPFSPILSCKIQFIVSHAPRKPANVRTTNILIYFYKLHNVFINCHLTHGLSLILYNISERKFYPSTLIKV